MSWLDLLVYLDRVLNGLVLSFQIFAPFILLSLLLTPAPFLLSWAGARASPERIRTKRALRKFEIRYRDGRGVASQGSLSGCSPEPEGGQLSATAGKGALSET